jgi:predicted aspartyl protease
MRSAVLAASLSMLAHAGARVASTPEGPVVVPFDFEKRQILLEVHAGSRGPYRFLLDTGTNPSVIDRTTAQALAIPLGEPSASGEGAGTGSMQVQRCVLPELRVGPITSIGLEAAAADLSRLSAELGRRIDGVLGYGFLKERVFTIDYSGRTLTFHPARGVDRETLHRRGRGRQVLSFEFSGEEKTPTARALAIDGSSAQWVTLDTGSSGFLAIHYDTAMRLGFKDRIEGAPIHSSEGYRGSFPSAMIRVDSLAFAGFEVGPEEVDVPLPGSRYGEDSRGNAVANAGNALLSRFRITFDYPRRVVVVERPLPTVEEEKR